MYNNRHKKSHSLARSEVTIAPNRNHSLSVNCQEVERATKMAEFITRRQTCVEKGDTFNLSNGSSTLQLDNFYSARVDGVSKALPPKILYNTLTGPIIQQLPQKSITLPLQ